MEGESGQLTQQDTGTRSEGSARKERTDEAWALWGLSADTDPAPIHEHLIHYKLKKKSWHIYILGAESFSAPIYNNFTQSWSTYIFKINRAFILLLYPQILAKNTSVRQRSYKTLSFRYIKKNYSPNTFSLFKIVLWRRLIFKAWFFKF